LVHKKYLLIFKYLVSAKVTKLNRSAKFFNNVHNYRSNATSTVALSRQSHVISSELFDLFKTRTEFKLFVQRQVHLYSQILPLNEKSVSLDAQVAGIRITHLANLGEPGNSVLFLMQNLNTFGLPNCFAAFLKLPAHMEYLQLRVFFPVAFPAVMKQ